MILGRKFLDFFAANPENENNDHGDKRVMSLLDKVFGKKKQLKGDDIGSLFNVMTTDREPVIIMTGKKSFKYVADIIEHERGIFHVKNTLSRDEILYQLKGKELQVQFPYELTLFGGTSQLIGLGMVNGVHTLKLRYPEVLEQDESRGAYRITTFPEQPAVTFSADQSNIVKARLIDLSMTGAGIRIDPRWMTGDLNLGARTHVLIDIRLSDQLRLSTTATVRYFDNPKMGVQFHELSRGIRERLFKMIVKQRREEQRVMMRTYDRINSIEAPVKDKALEPASAPTPVKSDGRPIALLVGSDNKLIQFLEGILSRKFDLLQSTPSFGDIRNQCHLGPNLCLMEVRIDDLAMVSNMKKAAAMLPPGCVLMYFGENLTPAFRERFLAGGLPRELLVDLAGRNKLMLFKHIERYYQQKAPQ